MRFLKVKNSSQIFLKKDSLAVDSMEETQLDETMD